MQKAYSSGERLKRKANATVGSIVKLVLPVTVLVDVGGRSASDAVGRSRHPESSALAVLGELDRVAPQGAS